MKSHPAHKRIRLCFFIVIESTGYAAQKLYFKHRAKRATNSNLIVTKKLSLERIAHLRAAVQVMQKTDISVHL